MIFSYAPAQRHVFRFQHQLFCIFQKLWLQTCINRWQAYSCSSLTVHISGSIHTGMFELWYSRDPVGALQRDHWFYSESKGSCLHYTLYWHGISSPLCYFLKKENKVFADPLYRCTWKVFSCLKLKFYWSFKVCVACIQWKHRNHASLEAVSRINRVYCMHTTNFILMT